MLEGTLILGGSITKFSAYRRKGLHELCDAIEHLVGEFVDLLMVVGLRDLAPSEINDFEGGI